MNQIRPMLSLAVGFLLIEFTFPSIALAAAAVSDEVIYTLQNGATQIPPVFALDQIIPENSIEALGGPSKQVLSWDPTKGVVTPQTIELIERGDPKYISDIMMLTVNVKSTVLSFSFVSDDETSLVGPTNGNVTRIVEDGTNQDVTRLLFPTFAAGAEPAHVTIKSDCNSTCSIPESSSWVMMALGFASLGFAGYRRSRRLLKFTA